MIVAVRGQGMAQARPEAGTSVVVVVVVVVPMGVPVAAPVVAGLAVMMIVRVRVVGSVLRRGMRAVRVIGCGELGHAVNLSA